MLSSLKLFNQNFLGQRLSNQNFFLVGSICLSRKMVHNRRKNELDMDIYMQNYVITSVRSYLNNCFYCARSEAGLLTANTRGYLFTITNCIMNETCLTLFCAIL